MIEHFPEGRACWRVRVEITATTPEGIYAALKMLPMDILVLEKDDLDCYFASYGGYQYRGKVERPSR